MRKRLAQEEGVRKKFRATFSRFGRKTNYHGYSEETILLTNVRDAITSEPVADHVWFTYSATFQQVKLTEGIQIEFEARVKSYRKGYVNRRAGINGSKTDFKLSYPGKVGIVTV